MIDQIIVKNKIRDIRNYLIEIRPILALPASEIINDQIKLHALERYFQLIVDTMLDINSHLIAASDLAVPDSYQSSFVVLSQNKLLTPELAQKIAPVVGLRNKLVHKYGDIDLKKFLTDLSEGSQQFEEYLTEIEKLLG